MLRPPPGGLASRLAVAYPVARRFRTGAILMMYSLVVFILVLITVLRRLAPVSSPAVGRPGPRRRARFAPAAPTGGYEQARVRAVVVLTA